MTQGLMVFGRTKEDNQKIMDFILDEEGYHAEFNAEGNFFFFEEQEDMYDDLERELDKLFAKYDINARFEGVWESMEPTSGITEQDITVGAKFKGNDGNVFVIDNVENITKFGILVHMVSSSDGMKFIESIKDILDFLNNDMKATKIVESLEKLEFKTFEHYLKLVENQSINELRNVTVKFDNGDTINTDMAAHLSDDEIKKYYKIGKEFNIGNSGKDKMAKVVDVIINESSSTDMLSTYGGIIAPESEWSTVNDSTLLGADKQPIVYQLVKVGDKMFKTNHLDLMKSNIGKQIRFKYDSTEVNPTIIQPKLMGQIVGFKNEASDKAKDFISNKIKKLKDEGYPQKQAVAIAYSYAKKQGYKVDESNENVFNVDTEVVYKDADGNFTLNGIVDKIYKQDGIDLYYVKGDNDTFGSYTKDELKLLLKEAKQRKPKFKTGDMVYSWQNPNYKARVAFVSDRGIQDGVDYGFHYKVTLKDDEGYTRSSKWMGEDSLSKTKEEKD